MAKATSSRKPARVKRKAQTAAKPAARKSGAARARRAGGAGSGRGVKGAAKPRTSMRLRRETAARAARAAEAREKDSRGHDKDLRAKDLIADVDGVAREARAEARVAPRASVPVVVKAAAAAAPPVETVRVPPPLPVPIASFTF